METTGEQASDVGGTGILELFGHKRFGARLAPADFLGVKMLRVEILGRGVVQVYAPSAVFSWTPCPEEVALKENGSWRVAPPELPAGEGAPAVVEASTPREDDDPSGGMIEVAPDREDLLENLRSILETTGRAALEGIPAGPGWDLLVRVHLEAADALGVDPDWPGDCEVCGADPGHPCADDCENAQDRAAHEKEEDRSADTGPF